MKANQLATLVLRLMGIYFLVDVIALFWMFSTLIAEEIHRSNFTPAAIGTLMSVIALVILGILLITCSVPWGQRIVPKAADETISAISFKQLQTLAFAITGILIFAGALPQLLTSIFRLLDSMSPQNQILNRLAGETNPYLIEYSVGELLKLALGLCLFFGASGFANFWSAMRNFATPKPPQTQ